jgi:flagellar biosynthesis/type III secretory pathway chaperone
MQSTNMTILAQLNPAATHKDLFHPTPRRAEPPRVRKRAHALLARVDQLLARIKKLEHMNRTLSHAVDEAWAENDRLHRLLAEAGKNAT